MKKLNIVLITIVGLLLSGMVAGIILNTNTNNMGTNTNEINYYIDDDLKISGSYFPDSAISIDDSATGVGAHNWTWAIAQEWCSGAGTSGNPFLIENVTMSISDASNPAIKIVNSNHTTYFKLNNVTLSNTHATGNGLWIENASNGIILDCNISNNGVYGLYMKTVNVTSITSSDFINNDYGIYCDDCVLNNITTCNSSLNSVHGLYMANCTYNDVSSSYFMNNTEDGLRIEDSDYNNFTVEADYNKRGLYIVDSDNCIVTGGEFRSNTIVGILIADDDGNSTDDTIYNNIFADNELNGADNSTAGNSWYYGTTGNNWDDYGYYDGNDDGIGDVPYLVGGTKGVYDNYPIYSDGTEPDLNLSSDEDADELFEDEEESTIYGLDPNVFIFIIVCIIVGGVLVVIGVLFMMKKIKVPKRKVIKRKINPKRYIH